MANVKASFPPNACWVKREGQTFEYLGPEGKEFASDAEINEWYAARARAGLGDAPRWEYHVEFWARDLLHYRQHLVESDDETARQMASNMFISSMEPTMRQQIFWSITDVRVIRLAQTDELPASAVYAVKKNTEDRERAEYERLRLKFDRPQQITIEKEGFL